jgi:hypothetical protein
VQYKSTEKVNFLSKIEGFVWLFGGIWPAKVGYLTEWAVI